MRQVYCAFELSCEDCSGLRVQSQDGRSLFARKKVRRVICGPKFKRELQASHPECGIPPSYREGYRSYYKGYKVGGEASED